MSCLRGVSLVAACGLLLASWSVCAQENPACPGSKEWETLLQRSDDLLSHGQAKECLELLRPVRGCDNQDPHFVLLLSRAYEKSGNLTWASKVLSDFLAKWPDSCAVRARWVWLLLKQADYRGAQSSLEGSACPATPEEGARWFLLRAEAERQAEEEAKARRSLESAEQFDAMFSEDAALLRRLRSGLWPLRTAGLELRGELDNGWTSNPLLGSPMDPTASREEFSSWKSELELRGRLGTPYWHGTRLVAEGDVRSQFLAAEAVRDLSYVGWGAKPGLEWALPWMVATLSYHYDSLWLSAKDDYGGRGVYYNGHRGEVQVQTAAGLYLMAGAGQRTFRVKGRSRDELDLGLGWGGALVPRLFLVAGLSGRKHAATNEAYDLFGATALTSLTWQFWPGWSLRLGLSAAADWYPESAGSEAFHSADKREELLIRGRFSVWAPALAGGIRLGIQYEPSRRFSTASLYDFVDHTLFLALVFTADGDPWHPAFLDSPSTCGSVDYGLESERGSMDERLQDLLRSDEESQRGSSCLD